MTDPIEYQSANTTAAPDVVAKAGKEYLLKRYAIVLMLIGAGLWFAYDGFVKWPRQNAEYAERGERLPHSDNDIRLQRILAFTLPPLGLLFIGWIHYNSRGAYRLSGNTLHVPGHPPIPLEAIHPLDEQNQRKWDRKGLAYFSYTLPGTNQTGKFRLDDFVYEQKPTDEIYDRIKAVTGPQPTDSADSQIESDEAVGPALPDEPVDQSDRVQP